MNSVGFRSRPMQQPYSRVTIQHNQIKPRFGALDNEIKQAVEQGQLPDHFVPTPPRLIQRMLDKAELKAGQRVLEPSAGQGHIAEAMRKQMQDAKPPLRIDVVEILPLLQNSLTRRGFNLVAENILTYQPGPVYDRILMNPPYGQGLDVIHTIHCFNLLKPGGKLLAILPEAAFDLSIRPGSQVMINPATGNRFNQDLHNLLTRPDVVYEVEKLPTQSFMDSDVPRTVDTRLVILTKK